MPALTTGTAQPSNAAKKDRYFTPNDVEAHDYEGDCWLSLLGKVLDVTPLVRANKNDPLIQPILTHAGKDISHWFSSDDGKLRTHIDPITGCEAPYVPQGRFLHVPPTMPRTDWCTLITKPWWMDDEKYCIGKLSSKTRKIKIVNTLTRDEHSLEVCSEESLSQIQERYLKQYNAHAKGYMWKRLGVLLDMSATLEANGIPDESSQFEMVGMSEDEWLPVLHLYFSDDLTVA